MSAQIRGRTLLPALLALCAPSGACSQRATDAAPQPPAEASAPLVAEVGFFDVPGQPSEATWEARLFYVFEPADSDSAQKPLVVLFNGGPGFATSAGLLSYGTGRRTLDPGADAGAVAYANAASWTRFANLLYIDARQTGFSYGLSDAGAPPCVTSESVDVGDASDFVRALLDFLDGHDALRGSPVILAGESYGGMRATWMLDLLLRYTTEAAKGGQDLPMRIQAHYDAVFPDRAGTVIDAPTASRQFGAQVLIEPLVLASAQAQAQENLGPAYVESPTDPEAIVLPDGGLADPYDALEPPGWSDGLDARAMHVLADPVQSALLIGAGLDTIPLIKPQARTAAFHSDRPWDGSDDAGEAAEDLLNLALTLQLGTLAPGDEYFALWSNACGGSSPEYAAFIANLRTVRTFITDARYDPAIYAPAIPAALKAMGLGGTIDTAPRPGVARPGWFSVNLPASDGAAATTVEVRFPPYVDSGHMVAVSQPADLAADVEAWILGLQ
jgi:hypothetical protein